MYARLFLCTVVSLHCFALGGCSGVRELEAIPTDLLGIWKTDAARYRNRFLEVRHGEVILGAGIYALDHFAVRRVEVEALDQGHLYRLHYRADEGYLDQLELALRPSPTPTLYVGKIPFPWRPSTTR